MLSTKLRLRLEAIAGKIARGEEVSLEDMIWADKLAKANRSAGEILRRARREAMFEGKMPRGGMDDFLNTMDLGDPDPSNHRTEFNGVDDIVRWFQQDKPEDWRQRD